MSSAKSVGIHVGIVLSALYLTGCSFVGDSRPKVINLSKLEVPNNNLALVDSKQEVRLATPYDADMSENMTLYPASVSSFGNHQYKLAPGKHSLKVRWQKSILGKDIIMMDHGTFDKKGRYTAMTMPMDFPTYTPIADHTYTISTMLLPGYIYALETPLEDETDNNPNGSPKRVCIKKSLQNKDEKLLKWSRVACTSG